MPLRQLAALWSSFQLALASLDRISAVLSLAGQHAAGAGRRGAAGPADLAFDHVTFGYVAGSPVLRDATFALERGKTYALVGPTGGGKTTTALLMARLYDPDGGRVLLDGRDIRALTPAERAARIGFILQEPFLFTGTVRDNLVYGNESLLRLSDEELAARIGATAPRHAARALQGRPDDAGDVDRRGAQPRPEADRRVHARGPARAGPADPRRGDGQHRHRHRAAARARSCASCRRRRPTSSSRTG